LFRGSAIVKSFKALIIALIAVGPIWTIATPAQAQLAAGCSCPAGFFPSGANTCEFNFVFVPAICTARNAINQSIGRIASSQQQQSFWGIDRILQQRRDQLQSTPRGDANSKITGYSDSNLDTNSSALGYSGQSQKNNPLASGLYDDAASSAAPPAPTYGAWLQGLADTEHDNPLSATDVAHSATTYTAQAGLDRTQQGILSSSDAFVIGIVASMMNTHTGYDGTPTTSNLSGPGVGVYTEYVNGGFSTDVTANFNFLNMIQNFAGTAPNTSIGILSSGVSGNVQYKISGIMGADSNFLEPTVGFSLSHTSFASAGTAMGLEDAYTVRLQAGARAGTTTDFGNGISLDSSLKALIYGNAIAQGTSATPLATTILSPSSLSPSDTGLIRMELDPQFCFNLPDNYSLTLSGQFRYGQAMVGGSAGVNLRKQW
jgi:hypothetical protein